MTTPEQEIAAVMWESESAQEGWGPAAAGLEEHECLEMGDAVCEYLRNHPEVLRLLMPEGWKVLAPVAEGEFVSDVVVLTEMHVVRLQPGDKPYLELPAPMHEG
ncbi:UNVERIFIED_CONTAM: hypothetical protein RF653_10265 [Kocuria sp. CPCC 205316]|uniref:hypothetical protein n=1 Tax=Kocuria TaxID=57493 RepID=UPI0036D8A338